MSFDTERPSYELFLNSRRTPSAPPRKRLNILMDSAKIKKELRRRGFDYSMLAEALNKSPSLISKVVARKAKSQPVALAIAKALELEIEEVFPDVEAYHHKPLTPAEREQKQQELKALLNK
ncbi:helix-turn-helix domain-containing protein [Idiomarina sp. FenBw--71]|nr:helix-turn-helix domain-containing protein [Idiomarina sp. FeN1]NCU56224.1 helix-turn-helix domain-containing protein [Idiomarina sp. FenA--70]NCU59243.1 helix-turn-helix domain-containing protein [Idiomarina sp. FenBw--71]